MSRNDMLLAISNALDGFNHLIDSDEIAEIVLEVVEKKGMIPPSVCYLADGEYGESKTFLEEIRGDFDVSFEWQPE